MRTALALLLAVLVIPASQRRIDSSLPSAPESERLAAWSGPAARALSFGFSDFWSDISWIRAIQYTGSERRFQKVKTFKNLEPLLNLTTDLDPRYDIAYRYGAFFLAEFQPLGPGDLPGALALLDKGLVAMPDNWQLLQWRAFCRSFYGNDPAGASADALRASRLPGAPSFLVALAASYQRTSGDLDAAEAMFKRLSEDPEEYLRTSGKRGLQQVALLRMTRSVEAMVKEWTRTKGAPPVDLSVLATAFPGLPIADPSGTPFEYDPQSGRVRIARASSLWSPQLAH